jgi:hypothetical protein
MLFLSTHYTLQEKVSESAPTQNNPQVLAAAAIKALGGERYLGVKTERSRGYVTTYKLGQDGKNSFPEAPQSFIDYVVLPDKERAEFKAQGRRFIQSNAGNQGWVYDSDAQLLRDQTEAQRQRFTRGLRYRLEQVLTALTQPNTQLSYLSRQEIWPRQFAQGVQLTYTDGEEVSIFFDPQSNLPISLRFVRENDKGERMMVENRFLKYLDVNEIKAPHVIDVLENGNQVLRLSYEVREFNVAIPEKLFLKPQNVKAIN